MDASPLVIDLCSSDDDDDDEVIIVPTLSSAAPLRNITNEKESNSSSKRKPAATTLVEHASDVDIDDSRVSESDQKMPASSSPSKTTMVLATMPKRFKLEGPSINLTSGTTDSYASTPHRAKNSVASLLPEPQTQDEHVQVLDRSVFHTGVASLPFSSQHKSGENDEEECQMIGHNGNFALADFPHSRENCVVHPMSYNGTNISHCVNCYCLVCDIPASDCKEWAQHCQARYADPQWRRERERRKAGQLLPPSVPAATVHRPARPAVASITEEQLQQYRQMQDLQDYSDNALLQHLTSIHPVEKNPPAAFATSLRHYQKQCLAFMYDIETSQVANLNREEGVRGGWLASEVGMGKTAVVLALIASNPSTDAPSKEALLKHLRVESKQARARIQNIIAQNGGYRMRHEEEQRRAEIYGKYKRIRIKATVVITHVSLLGQWEDECKKHAPNLKVRRFRPYGESTKTNSLKYSGISELAADLFEADIILTTATFYWRDGLRSMLEFHRVVLDESHLLDSATSMKYFHCNNVLANFRWCVTATPFASPNALWRQRNFIKIQDNFLMAAERAPPKVRFYHLAATLKPLMIRHTKNQRIRGEAALALPASTAHTAMAEMTEMERRHYNISWSQGRRRLQSFQGGAKLFAVETSGMSCASPAIFLRMEADVRQCSKIQRLVSDVRNLVAREEKASRIPPRVVVFTRYKGMLKAAVHHLKAFMDVYTFDGSTDSSKRDKYIREFQDVTRPKYEKLRPAAFVITLRTGSVGITLTAASHVYMMEPCVDVTTETQAAGRIHRLGQTKRVEVTRYVYKDSVEERLLKLQSELVAGRVRLLQDGKLPVEGIRILTS